MYLVLLSVTCNILNQELQRAWQDLLKLKDSYYEVQFMHCIVRH